jgi:hypothetical protein
MVVIHETGDVNPLEATLETNTEHTLPVFHCPSLLTSTKKCLSIIWIKVVNKKSFFVEIIFVSERNIYLYNATRNLHINTMTKNPTI